MILQALYEYYQRKAADPESRIAPEGWEWKEIPYVIVIDQDGRFVRIEETFEEEGKQRRAHSFLVPQSVKRTVGIDANLLWDNIEYALGANPRGRSDVYLRQNKFRHKIENLYGRTKHPAAACLLKFLDHDPVKQIESSPFALLWQKMMEENPFVIFRIEGHKGETICEEMQSFISEESGNHEMGTCLITGETNVPIARLHPAVKGVVGANSTGASLVSFNLDPFNSYYKKQNYNAPISKKAAFAYTTAINTLLAKDSTNKIWIGDLTIVFWAEAKNRHQNKTFDLESEFPWYFSDDRDDPDKGVQAVKGLYEAVKSGKIRLNDERFYLLGLAPNAGRIAVSFFRQGKVSEFGAKIYRHFKDFEIVQSPKEPLYLSLSRILTATALEYKVENMPPNLAAAVVQSVLDGTPYPRTLLQQCIRRIRAERSVTRARAAIIKAVFNRFSRFHNPSEKEISMALDPANAHVGYLLGRLFAVLEKIQEEANPGINATIRDRFYGAASSSPAAVFPQLMKLKNHHLGKLENTGRRIFIERLIGEILSQVSYFPGHLRLEDQGYFAIGYYHQRQSFFTAKIENPSNE